MDMERYVVFIKKVATGEEFVSSRRGEADSHDLILKDAEKKYPYPSYIVHTVYTERELQNVLDGVKRWCTAPQDVITMGETGEQAAAEKMQASPAGQVIN